MTTFWIRKICEWLVFLLALSLIGCAGAPVRMGIPEAESILGTPLGQHIQAVLNGLEGFAVRSMVQTEYIVLGWIDGDNLDMVLLDTKARAFLDWGKLSSRDWNGFSRWTTVMQFAQIQVDDARLALCEGAILAKSWLATYTAVELVPVLTISGFTDLPYQFLPAAGEVR